MKVAKFGGSSMADAGQYRKVKSIIESDPERRVVVVSAAGKRFKDDHKITDLLYLCYSHTKYGVPCDLVYDMIVSRYCGIRDELGIDDGQTTADGLFSLKCVACLGCCSLSPVMMINEDTYGSLTPDKTKKILKELREAAQ